MVIVHFGFWQVFWCSWVCEAKWWAGPQPYEFMCIGCGKRVSRHSVLLWCQWWIQVTNRFLAELCDLCIRNLIVPVICSFVLKKDSQFYQRRARFCSIILLIVPRLYMLLINTLYGFISLHLETEGKQPNT